MRALVLDDRSATGGGAATVTDCPSRGDGGKEDEAGINPLLTHTDAVAVVVDASGILTHINPSGCRLLGADAESLVGSSWVETFVAPERRTIARKHHADTMASRERFSQFPLEVIDVNGTRHLVAWHCTALRDDAGRVCAALALGTPETQDFAFGDLGSAADLRAILDASRVGIAVVNADPATKMRIIRRCNQRLVEILGYDSPQDLTGLPVNVVHLSSESAAYFGEKHFSALTNHEQIHIEYQLRHRDGHAVWCLMSGKAIDASVPADLTKGVIWVVDDLTARKTLETALIEAREDAEAANKAKSQFLANMSHELRTPMNAILGFSEIMGLQTFGPLPDPYKEYASLIHRSGRHLLEIINQILDLAKIEAGRVELSIGHHPMHDVVEDVFELLSDTAALKGITLVNRTECLHDVHFDRVRIRQALLNVIGNAIKFSSGGTVTVRNQCGNGLHSLVIQDTGPGMTRDEIKEALKPFGQVGRDSTVRGAEGTGLGLTVTQQIMRLHRGDLTVESVKGQGTTVTLTLPEGLNRAVSLDRDPPLTPIGKGRHLEI